MNRTTMMAVLAAVVMVAVASAAAAVMLSPAPTAGEEDYRGHWYALESEIYDSDGTYRHFSANESRTYGMDIYSHDGDVFTGRAMGADICGTLHDGHITFSTYEDRGILFTGNGNFIGGTLYMSIYYYGIIGSESAIGVIGAVMSKDIASTADMPDSDSILGLWKLVDGIIYNGETHSVTRGTVMNVTGQIGCIFKGTVELDSPGTMPLSFDTRGGFHYVNGSVGIGMMIDEQGCLWNMYMDGGILTIESVKMMGFEPDEGLAREGVERRSYSQDKSAVYTPFKVDRDLVGSTWRSVKVEETDRRGNVFVSGAKSFLTMTEGYENYLFCIESTSTGPVPVVVMYHADGEGVSRAMNDRSGDDCVLTDITFSDDDHFVVHATLADGNDTRIVAKYFERYTADTEYDITGHWYATFHAGYDENGNYVSETLADTKAISEFDIDVYTFEEGLFRGWFMDRYIVGYCEGDGITFLDTAHEMRYHVVGTFENSNSLVINEAYWSGDGEQISGYTTYLTRDRGAVSPQTVDLDVSGRWTLSEGTAYYPDVAVPLEKPQHMEVSSSSNGTFIGIMDAKNEENAIEEVGIRGAVLPSVGSEILTGFILSDKGNLWFCRFTDSTIYMSRSNVSVNPDHQGEASVVEKIFTRGGSMSTIALPEDDITGTWKAVDVQMLSNDGTYSEDDMDYVLVADSHTRNIILGTCSYDVILTGEFSMTLQYLGSLTVFDYGISFAGVADTGTGVLIDSEHFVVIEWYHDATGSEWVQKTTFERQTQ